MIGKTISHYKIMEKIGSGGMGDVYKAVDTKLQREVAMKFLPPEFIRDEDARKRLVQEARAASALDHPNIGTIYEIDESEGQFFIAMAYYKGQTLKEKVSPSADTGRTTSQQLAVDQSISIAIQIAKGLARAHSKNIIHRDIKPANILITEDGQIKIIDFGLAKLKDHSMLTKTGTTMGTVAYMSPEQSRGEQVDHRSDIWALGIILYEMLTGDQPFKGDYPEAIIYSILNEEPEYINKMRSEVPTGIEHILEKALSKNPEKRFQSMEEMLEALNIIVEDLKEEKPYKAAYFRLGRKQRKLFYRAVAVILLLIVFGIYIWRGEVAKGQPVSIALLPLQSLTHDVEQEWFTDSITDALITDLAKISGLRVISRSSAMKYKGTNKTPPEIASELGVHYVIEGSVVKMGELVKISARLIDAVNDEYLWAEKYEQGFSNILGLQTEIAKAIAGQIQVELTPQEETRLAVSRSVDPETHELYLKGMFHLNKYTPDGIEIGLTYLHQAVEKDPKDPLAHAGLALAYSMIAHSPAPPPDVYTKAKSFAQKALELDETLAEAYAALAEINLYWDWDFMGASEASQRALELNSNLAGAHAQYAWYILLTGNPEDALKRMHKAKQLDPLTPIFPAWLGWQYWWTGEYNKAIEEALNSLELLPDFPVGLYILGNAYARKGMFDEAIKYHKRAGVVDPAWKWALGHTYALAGLEEKALEVLADLKKQDIVWTTWGIAEIYAALGEKEEAFRWLNAAYQQRHSYMPWIHCNPNFERLREDVQFQDLVQRLNLTNYVSSVKSS